MALKSTNKKLIETLKSMGIMERKCVMNYQLLRESCKKTNLFSQQMPGACQKWE